MRGRERHQGLIATVIIVVVSASLAGGSTTGTPILIPSEQASAAATKYSLIRPTQVVNAVLRISKQDNFGLSFADFMNLSAVSFSGRGWILSGSCTGDIYLRKVVARGGKQTQFNCEGNRPQTSDIPRDRPEGFYADETEQLGATIAQQASIGDASVGPVRKVSASTKRSTAWYRRAATDPGDGEVRQVRTIVLKAKGDARVTLFPQSSS